MLTARRILDRGNRIKLAKDVRALLPFIRDTWELLEQTYNRGGRVLVEGTQGTGLSIFHGAYPYVTSRDTTVSGLPVRSRHFSDKGRKSNHGV